MKVREAGVEDADTILDFIRALARYEREPDAVRTTAANLRAQMAATSPPFHCLLAEADARPVGFALYFFNYSTWRGRPGLFVEDIFVDPSARRGGVGRALMQALARIAVERDCGRMEWMVLDWNQPAIDFYAQLGARPLDAWTTHRLESAEIRRLAEGT